MSDVPNLSNLSNLSNLPNLSGLSGLDLSSVIDTVSKNPELLTLAKEMMSGLQKSPDTSDASAKDTVSVKDTKGKDLSELASILPSLVSAEKGKDAKSSNRDALLCALRPYLSPERQSALDKLLSVEKLGAVLSRLESKDVPK